MGYKEPDDPVWSGHAPMNLHVWQVRRWLPYEGWMVVSEHDTQDEADAAADALRELLGRNDG